MTNKFKSAVLAATAVLTVGLSATSASAATTAQGSATANIVGALDIVAVNGTSLNFGTIVPNATTAGDVVVSTAGVRTSCGGHTCSGTVDAQEFTVTGTANQFVVVTHNATVQLSNGVTTMDVALVDTATGGALSNTFQLGAGGTYTLAFGGALTVNAAQQAGVYSANFDVSVAYQ